LLGSGALAGCGGGAEGDDIIFSWTHDDNGVLPKMIDAFNKQSDGFKVRFREIDLGRAQGAGQRGAAGRGLAVRVRLPGRGVRGRRVHRARVHLDPRRRRARPQRPEPGRGGEPRVRGWPHDRAELDRGWRHHPRHAPVPGRRVPWGLRARGLRVLAQLALRLRTPLRPRRVQDQAGSGRRRPATRGRRSEREHAGDGTSSSTPPRRSRIRPGSSSGG
jgi:hypothetical protein